MAGLLTFPQSALPSQPCERPVTFSKQTLCLRGLQLQVQFRTLTGFPCIEVAPATRLPSFTAAKVQLFPQLPTILQKYSKNKKRKHPNPPALNPDKQSLRLFARWSFFVIFASKNLL